MRMKKSVWYSHELKKRAIKLVYEKQKEHTSNRQQSSQILENCILRTMQEWIKQHEIGYSMHKGFSTAKRERISSLRVDYTNCVRPIK